MEFICKMCGSELYPEDGDKTVVCDVCGSEQTLPVADDSHKVNMFNEANNYRLQKRFDEAANLYKNIISEYPEECDAHWGLVLCEYGIEYVDDKKTERKIPTCNRTLRTSIFDHEEYKKAVEKATDEERAIYEREAKEIDGYQKKILEISDKEAPYDVFICYKETAEDGKRTKDSQLATKIYDNLTGKGYKVFFSRITLKNKLGSEYEPVIFAALQSAKVMLVVGTKTEYLEAVWVRNEWSRYLGFMEEDVDKVIVPCYKDLDPYDLPEELQEFQAQDMGDMDFIENLSRAIDSKFGRQPQYYGYGAPAAPVAPATPAAPAQDKSKTLKKIQLSLLNGKFDAANELIDDALLDDFDSEELWELKVQALLKGEKKPNDEAKRVYLHLLEMCAPEKKAGYEEKYSFMTKSAPTAPAVPAAAPARAPVAPTPVAPVAPIPAEPTPARRGGSTGPIGEPIRFDRPKGAPTSGATVSGASAAFDRMFGQAEAPAPKNPEAEAESCFQKGEKHYEKKEYFNAVKLFEKAAAQGHLNAKVRLADCYYYGNGVLQNHDEAFKRYLEAAKLGSSEAANKLAMCYDDGLGTATDKKKAFEWYKKAAEAGHYYAQRNLAECYRSGKGVEKSMPKAVEWYKKAAESGDADAQNSLGYLYEIGKNVKQDYTEAFRWYRRAAEQGNREAQCNLGLLYYYAKVNGMQDCDAAAEWYKKAADNGHAVAQYNLAVLYKTGRVKGGKNAEEAAYWFRRSAMQGYVFAQFKLGLAYERGDGVEKDFETAYYWYQKAANQNYEDAKLALSRISNFIK